MGIKKISKKHVNKGVYLTIEDVKKLINSIKDMRDNLMLRLLYETGCTLAELVRIKSSDISGNNIKLKDSVTNELRYSTISRKLESDLFLFIKGNAISNDHCILSTKNKEQISEKRVRQLIQFYSAKVGLGKVNPKMLRYFHIAHAYENGVFIDNISSQLGMTNLRIFQIITDMNVRISKNNYNKFYDALEA
jgi:site-specific recombinase XerD